MAPRPELARQAHGFADSLSALLNSTVTNGPRLTAVLREDGEVGWIGYRISKFRPFPGDGIPLTINAKEPKAFLHVMQTLRLDPEAGYLLVQRSTYGLHLENTHERVVFHYDYDRAPENAYPIAHLQVDGVSAALDELHSRRGTSGPLGRLHFPVGGKRYRPSLEDIVEFLIVEGLAEGKADWKSAVDMHRENFHKIQLMAAARRDPESAISALAGLGYKIDAPPPS